MVPPVDGEELVIKFSLCLRSSKTKEVSQPVQLIILPIFLPAGFPEPTDIRMEPDHRPVSEDIISLTLEIVFLLTGEVSFLPHL